MTLSEKSRMSLYSGPIDIADEEAVEEMLSHFPAHDEQPGSCERQRAHSRSDEAPKGRGTAASKEFIGAAIGDLRADVNRDIAELRTEVKGDIADLRTDMADLRTEVKGDIGRLEVALERGLRLQAAASVGAVAATLGIVSAANGLF